MLAEMAVAEGQAVVALLRVLLGGRKNDEGERIWRERTNKGYVCFKKNKTLIFHCSMIQKI